VISANFITISPEVSCMLTALLVAFNYQYKLILGPALIIFLAVTLALALKYPLARTKISGVLLLVGLVELMGTAFVAFTFGIVTAIVTLLMGAVLRVLASVTIKKSLAAPPKLHLSSRKARLLRRTAFSLVVIVVLVSAVVISVRATGLVREDYVENFHFAAAAPNVTINGTIASVAFNYEVSTGYSYHIFPAYITLNAPVLVSGSFPWQNQSTTSQLLHQQGTIIVYYEKTGILNLAVGQHVEVSGYYCPWMEDSLYSNRLVVSPNVNGSYLSPL